MSTLVTDGTLTAKIDRPHGIVAFAPPKPPEETLSDWAADISKLLTLVDETCHLINKDQMVQYAPWAHRTTASPARAPACCVSDRVPGQKAAKRSLPWSAAVIPSGCGCTLRSARV